MPKIGLFDVFDNLDLISPESIASWLKNPPNLFQLENYLANKVLYPQTLPMTSLEQQIEMAILREVLKMNGPKESQENEFMGDNPFINVTLRKILIPVSFLNFSSDLKNLAWTFIDAFLLNRKKQDFFQDLWTLILTDDTDEVIGSVLLPQFESKTGEMELMVQNKKFKILPGGLTVIPCSKDRCQISYKLRNGQILGKNEAALEVSGGRLGLVVDGRSG